jgi:hypothetical protein
MKGTLFTADFVRKADGSLKLLEVNTDTAIQNSLVASQISWNEFIPVLTENSITDIQVLYKNVQKSIVDDLEQALIDADGGFTLTRHIEGDTSIYPTVITDQAGRFILRLAYDASAVFDSTYASQDLNLYKLFIDNEEESKVPGLYYSGSESPEVLDTLEDIVNPSNIADIALRKTYSIKGHDLSFYKLGNTELPTADRLAAAKSQLAGEGNILTNYYVPSGATKSTSLRIYQIVYGANLDLITLGGYTIDAILDFPTALDVPLTDAANKIPLKHYSELSVEGINRVAGITPDHSLVKLDGTGDLAQNVVVGDVYKSYFVNGAPDTDQYGTLFQWSNSGSELPTGSYATGSVLISTQAHTPTNNSIIKITLEDGGIMRLGPLSNVLVYQYATNSVRYIYASSLTEADSLFDVNGSKVGIQTLQVEILDNEADSTTYEFNLEDTDIFIVSGSDIIVHNSPCFIAGTEVALANGDTKNIEHIVPGDSVLSFNHKYSSVEEQTVLSTQEKIVNSVVEIRTEEGSKISATVDHPFFVRDKGYCSFDPSATLEDSGLEVRGLSVGDKLVTLEGSNEKVKSLHVINDTFTVYNLDNVSGNKNFFANNFLVHNRYK